MQIDQKPSNQPQTIEAACSMLQANLSRQKQPFIMGITGDSGSGKTTFSDGIRRLFGKDLVKTIQMDGYHKENRAQRKISGSLPLDPSANHLDKLRDHLQGLKQGKIVDIPIYNHNTGDFDPPQPFTPSPIIIVEGLHALYPQLLPFLDFTIFVDPCREVKWQWKFERDVKKRGHRAEVLEEEMLKREAAYKRWIDFQKTNAHVVIKIFNSRLKEFARYEFTHKLPEKFYKVELIIVPSRAPLPSLPLPFDLAAIMDMSGPPFLLAAVPCIYWGRNIINVHLDGAISEKTIEALEQHIVGCTGIPVNYEAEEGDTRSLAKAEEISATQFTQLIIAWRFLEEINFKLIERLNKRQ